VTSPTKAALRLSGRLLLPEIVHAERPIINGGGAGAGQMRGGCYSPAMRTFATRLRPGQDLNRELLDLAERERIHAGWVLTCVGSLSRVTLRLAGAERRLTRDGTFEIVSLVGTISRGGGHLHLAASDEEGTTVGGHLLDGCVVRTTAEVVLGADERLVFDRRHDPETGYDELVVGERQP